MTTWNRRATDQEGETVRPVNQDSTEAEILNTMNHLLQSQERIELKLEMLYQERGQAKMTDDKIAAINLELNTIKTSAIMIDKQGSTYRWLIGIVITLFAIVVGVASTHIVWK